MRLWQKDYLRGNEMYKILAISDIHIGDYKTYNPEANFRLNQFTRLADFICDVTKEECVNEVWIAGDLLQVAQSTPQVMSVVKYFLKTISTHSKVRITLGNHDVMVRTNKTSISEYNNYTLIGLLDTLPNVEIYNNSVVDINNKKVYFHSWNPDNTFEHKEADYLVCHGDIDKTLSPFANSYIDSTGYTKVFCGHIHIFKEINNVLSLGTPIMHSFSDSPDVGLTIYDLDSDTHKRVPTKGLFLEFKYTETLEDALEVQEYAEARGDDVVVKVKPKKEDSVDIDITNFSLDPKKAILQFTDDISENAKLTINDVIATSLQNDEELPDLRVHLKTLKAKNFLSIRKLDFNFEKFKGLTTIKGTVGSGKTTLFNLLEFMFFGKLQGYTKSDYSNVHKEPFEGELTFEYKGKTYFIQRKLSSLEYSINGKFVESNRKADLQKELEQELKFLKFWNLIYIKQSSTGIFSDMSDTSKVSFLSQLIGLTTIKSWTDILTEKLKDKKDEVVSDKNEQVKIETNIQALESYNNQNANITKLIDVDEITQNIQNNKLKITELDDKITKCDEFIQSIKLKDLEYKNKENECREISNEIVRCYNESVEISNKINSLPKFDENLKEPLAPSLPIRKESTVQKDIIEVSTKISRCTEKLQTLENSPSICPTCGQSWHKIDNTENIEKLRDIIKQLREKLTNLNAQKELEDREFEKSTNEYKVKLQEYHEDLKKFNENTNVGSFINEQKELDTKLTKKIGILSRKLQKLADYILQKDYDDKFTLSFTIKGDKPDLSKIDLLEKKKNDINIEKMQLLEDNNELSIKLGEANYNNTIFRKIQENIESIKNLNTQLNELKNTVAEKNSVIDELSKFNNKILSDKGLLVATLLQKVSEYLNTDKDLKVETVEELQNGSLHPTLNIKLFVKAYGKFVNYNLLSGGQRLLADLKFLKGITDTLGSVSVLLLDETFKFFSTEYVYEGVEIIKNMNVDKSFLILHGSDTENFGDQNLNVTLTENGSEYV